MSSFLAISFQNMQAIQQRNIERPLQKLESHLFIENHSKALKNISRGELFEQQASLFYHQKNLPVLISPWLLRSYGCGQIDLSYLKSNRLYLCELKSGRSVLTSEQRKRLHRSQELLASLLDLDTRLLFINQLPKI